MRHQSFFAQKTEAKIIPENGSLVFYSPYDPGLVAAIKSQIPAQERKFDPGRKAWIVAPQHGDLLSKMVLCYLNQNIAVPQMQVSTSPELRVLTIHYIGRTKDRPGYDIRTALALDETGDWSAIFSEDVLITWFTGMKSQATAITLYGVLGIVRGSTPAEINVSYRRLAKYLHPDVNKEPDAHERFLQLQKAYELLDDPNKRARYDAGLALEESLQTNRASSSYITTITIPSIDGYRSPLRCGHVLCEGIEKVGRFNVNKILSWEDITDSYGRTLVTSWPMGADKPVESWV